MEQIKFCMTKFLSLIDNGKFFIQPMRWLYVFFGCLSFVPVLLVLYFLYDSGISNLLRYAEGWEKFSGYLFFFIYVIFTIVSAILMFFFWMNRSRKVMQVANEGDQIVAMPVWAHYVQSVLESIGVCTFMLPPMGAVLFFLWGLVSGFKYVSHTFEFSDYLKTLLIGLLILAFFVLICFLISYIIILLAHYIGESIRVRAQIANDVRDLGDIHRAVTILREAEETAVETTDETDTVE